MCIYVYTYKVRFSNQQKTCSKKDKGTHPILQALKDIIEETFTGCMLTMNSKFIFNWNHSLLEVLRK